MSGVLRHALRKLIGIGLYPASSGWQTRSSAMLTAVECSPHVVMMRRRFMSTAWYPMLGKRRCQMADAVSMSSSPSALKIVSWVSRADSMSSVPCSPVSSLVFCPTLMALKVSRARMTGSAVSSALRSSFSWVPAIRLNSADCRPSWGLGWVMRMASARLTMPLLVLPAHLRYEFSVRWPRLSATPRLTGFGMFP